VHILSHERGKGNGKLYKRVGFLSVVFEHFSRVTAVTRHPALRIMGFSPENG
jgi:hypothetical protein